MEREGVSLIKPKSDQWSGKRSYHWDSKCSLGNIFITVAKKEMQVSLRENQDLHEYVDTNTGNKQKHITATSD